MIARTLLLIALSSSASARQAPRHPLDPLTAAEISKAVTVIRGSGRATSETRFGTITAEPRAKAGNEPRAARVLGFDWTRNEGFVAVVDLDAGRLASWTVVDSEPPMRLLTIRRAEEIAHADLRWVAAMRSRNIDTSRVSVLVGLPERAKLPRRGTDRVIRGHLWMRDGNPETPVVPGLTMEINLTRAKLETFADSGAGAKKRADSEAALANARVPLPPLNIQQPAGSALKITGNEILWDHWRLRVGVDPRRGLEVHEVSFSDAGRWRSILYSGSISEIVAPYGDAEFGTWYPRDEGDYGMGIYSRSSAVELNDVPSNARFLPSTMHDAFGRPIVVPRAIAVYERDGGVLWRHANISRRARQLVISGHSTIDNYDYQFNWIFGQDGAIDGEVILSGVMNVNSTTSTIDTAHVAGHTVFGHLVAPNVNAPNHQHFFSYRLDLDVDGTANTVYSVDTRAPSTDNPKGEFVGMTDRPLTSERDGVADVSFSTARHWRVSNTHTKNSLGQFTAYTLVPGAATPMFATATSEPGRIAGFAMHQLWVTPFSPSETFAGGEFQNLGRDGEGLPKWTSANRSLTDTDVVLWYTLGITHLPRPEDWPYMPAHRGGFRLVPTSFFSRNPALDVPAARP